MFKKITFLLILALTLVLVACGGQSDLETEDAEVDESYPDKPVTLYVNYSAGGNTDLNYRKLADVAEKYLGEQIKIENITGGGGTTGIVELAKAEPDGYTLGNVSMAPMTVTPHNQEVPYSPSDFTYLGGWGKQLYGLVAAKDAPYDDLDSFVEYARENPGLEFSDPAPGGLNGLVVTLLDRVEDNELNFKSIPYDGGGEATSAVLGNHVEFTSNNPAPLISGLENGDLKLIASMSDTRFDTHPDQPTASESGYDVDVTSWFGIGGPTGMPENVQEVWAEVIQKTLEDPEFQEVAEDLQTPLEWMPGDEYEELINDNYELYGELIEEQNE